VRHDRPHNRMRKGHQMTTLYRAYTSTHEAEDGATDVPVGAIS
jgi:hypothetical protein